ncbi:MAG: hypothetical protein IE922_12415 [Sphingomonadales bacterium]|nr:hypothetical protein [Sphingomonadales bacterium]
MPFIFSRRFVQQCLDQLRPVLSDDQHRTLVDRLNRRNPGRLAAMWEVVVLCAFAQSPGFRHEAPLAGRTAPDFQFDLPQIGVHVVGDVGSVSDQGSHGENPFEGLIDEIARVARKHGSDISQFEIYVPGREEGEYRKRKMRLSLPRGRDIAHFTRCDLEPYIRERLRRRDYGRCTTLSAGEYQVQITFRPPSDFAHYGHPSFTTILHKDRNVIWNTLKAKAAQLRGAPEGAVRLLILCDAGCAAMSLPPLGHGISARDVVREFLRRENGLDLVVRMTVRDEAFAAGRRGLRHDWDWAARPGWLDACPRNREVLGALQTLLNDFGAALPAPVSNAVSAAKNCLSMDYGEGALGGYQMHGRRFTISARTVQRVLAAQLTIDAFNEAYDWGAGELMTNRFAAALNAGQTIASIRLVQGTTQDDDMLEIEFAADPAISPLS